MNIKGITNTVTKQDYHITAEIFVTATLVLVDYLIPICRMGQQFVYVQICMINKKVPSSRSVYTLRLSLIHPDNQSQSLF